MRHLAPRPLLPFNTKQKAQPFRAGLCVFGSYAARSGCPVSPVFRKCLCQKRRVRRRRSRGLGRTRRPAAGRRNVGQVCAKSAVSAVRSQNARVAETITDGSKTSVHRIVPGAYLNERLGSTGQRKAHPPKDTSKPTQCFDEAWNGFWDSRNAD